MLAAAPSRSARDDAADRAELHGSARPFREGAGPDARDAGDSHDGRACSGAPRARDHRPGTSSRTATRDLTADHIQALEDGGAPFDPANVRILCRSWNSRLGALLVQRRQALPAYSMQPAMHSARRASWAALGISDIPAWTVCASWARACGEVGFAGHFVVSVHRASDLWSMARGDRQLNPERRPLPCSRAGRPDPSAHGLGERLRDRETKSAAADFS